MRWCAHVFASEHVRVGDCVAEAEGAGPIVDAIVVFDVDLEGFIVGVVNADALGDRG